MMMVMMMMMGLSSSQELEDRVEELENKVKELRGERLAREVQVRKEVCEELQVQFVKIEDMYR